MRNWIRRNTEGNFFDKSYPLYFDFAFFCGKMLSALSCGKGTRANVQHRPNRLNQGVFILAAPLNVTAHGAGGGVDAVYRIAGVNRFWIGQKIRSQVVGMIYHEIGVQSVEMVLQVGKID